MKRVFRSLIKRPIKNYNVQDRAQKFIEKREKDLEKASELDKGNVDLSKIAAPKHQSSLDHLDKIRQEHPEFLDEYTQKNEDLLQRMSGMVVNPERPVEFKSKPVPRGSGPIEPDTEFGYKEPSNIPEGKCSIRQAVHFITEHSKNPDTYTAAHIAREYKLEEATVESVLKHFQTLNIQFVKDPTRYDPSVEGDMTPQKLINTTMDTK